MVGGILKTLARGGPGIRPEVNVFAISKKPKRII